MFKSGMIVRDARGTIIEVESFIDAGEGYFSITGIKLKADMTPDQRKWSQRESIIHSPNNQCEVIRQY